MGGGENASVYALAGGAALLARTVFYACFVPVEREITFGFPAGCAPYSSRAL